MIILFPDLEQWRRVFPSEKSLIVTNGCFDVLHSGHCRYLQEAKSLGDYLLVGINSDSSVRQIKGQGRPVTRESDRAFVLDSLRCVDAVCIFDSIKADKFLALVKPDTYVKGGDYTLDSLDREEKKVLEVNGSRIVLSRFEKGLSTTNILEKINRL